MAKKEDKIVEKFEKAAGELRELSTEDLGAVSGGNGGKPWTRYWCPKCNCPHILDDPNNICPIYGIELRPM